jgi:beta-galactosidase
VILEDQDHWWLSGIYRDVILYVKESILIADYVVSTNVPEGSVGSALLVADVFVHEAVTDDVSLPSDVNVEVQLYDANRELVADATTVIWNYVTQGKYTVNHLKSLHRISLEK